MRHTGLGLTANAADRNSGATLTVPPGYHLVFSDDFHSLSIGDKDGAGTRWYSHTIQCCMSDTSAPSTPTHMAGLSDPEGKSPFSLVPGGGLDIRLQKTNGEWYSGVLATVDRNGDGFSQQYGYFEMRAKFPADPGTWPAFWLLNTAALKEHAPAGEIDVVESYMFAPDYVNITLHDWTPPSKVLVHNLSHVSNLSGGFHTYSVLWTEFQMEFALDGKILVSTPTPAIMHQPYYPVIDLGLGGGWPTNKTPARSDLIVQYVRVWSL